MAAIRPHCNKVGDVVNSAVELKGIEVSYGKKADKSKILDGIDLEIAEGTIYGLLGPSGCGKTTLLRCIVGKIKPDHGTVRIFGISPGSKGSSIPGRGVGYMPQGIALYKEFTIVDVLTYYGNLYCLDVQFITERIDFLMNFLDLPDKTCLIKNLSGGQQRRVSIAVALIHVPPLLILDEPTVGVDPLLRQNIWNHLVTLAKTHKMTIIITTHYIEEARQANMVGMLRQGHLLANSEPFALIRQYNMNTLEEVFLKLCQNNDVEGSNATAVEMTDMEYTATQDQISQVVCTANADKIQHINDNDVADAITNIMNVRQQIRSANEDNASDASSMQEVPPPSYYQSKNANSSVRKTKTVFLKNILRLSGNVSVLLTQILLPAVHAALFCICVGRQPFDLETGVSNYEKPNGNFSELFLDSIPKKTIKQIDYNNTEDAIKQVKRGKLWAAVNIEKEYTECLMNRLEYGVMADDDKIECSIITVHMDMANPIVTYTLFKTFLLSFEKFLRHVTKIIDISPHLIDFPLKLESLYGTLYAKFAESMLPGIMLIIIFMMSESFAALSLVSEKREGLMERDWIAGATEMNVILALAMTQFLIMVFQVVFCHFVVLVIFEVEFRGSFLLLWLLTILQGTCGMICGLAISTFADQDNAAVTLLMGTFFVNFFLSGLVWPIEAMPYLLRYISYVMPQTIAAEGIRSLFARGWDFGNAVVWQSFLITWCWIIVYFILSRIGLNMKK